MDGAVIGDNLLGGDGVKVGTSSVHWYSYTFYELFEAVLDFT